MAFIKGAIAMPEKSLGKYMERVIVAMGFIERRIQFLDESIFDPNQKVVIPGKNHELDLITDDIYYFIQDGKQDLTRAPWYVRLLK